MNFSTTLIQWYAQNKRELPWRNTQNPYHIWLSEIILQQTRVAQGLSYYNEFTQNFPTIKDLALADESLIMKTWQGLGYYSRARNLHATAQYIHNELNGIFPKTYEQIIQLKGIGPYTAAAIASFAFKEPVAVVDGNVFRVFARYFGIYDDISLSKSRKIFQELGNELIDIHQPDQFNQALMDFGATLCKPKAPECTICPFQATCFAYENNAIEELPVKNKKLQIKNRYFHYVLIEKEDAICIEKRIEKDIWQSLYQFPLVEIEHSLELQEVQKIIAERFDTTEENVWLYKDEVKHKLSHQQLHIYFWKVETSADLKYEHISKEESKEYAFPIVLWNHIVSKF